MRIALAQERSPAGDEAAAFGAVRRALAASAAAGAALCVMPELFVPGYGQDGPAQERGGDWEARLSDAARDAGCGLAVGWAERDGDATYNAATCFGADGAVLGHYRKRHLWGSREAALFAPGTGDCHFEIAGRRCALLVCYDVEFPERVRDLARAGAEIVLVPTANPAGYPFVPDALVRARAIENAVGVVYANNCGTEGAISYDGNSIIVAPDGAVIARAGAAPALLIADMPERADLEGLSTQIAELDALAGPRG